MLETPLATPEVKASLELDAYKDKVYGPWFQVVGYAADEILGVTSYFQSIQVRHHLVFVLFFLGCVFTYRSILLLFSDPLNALLSTLLLLTYPRFFAEAFYNVKDMVFLSVMAIALYYVLSFIKEPTKKNAIQCGLCTGLAVATRVLGVLLFVEVMTLLLLDTVFTKKPKLQIAGHALLYAGMSYVSCVLLWPFLWSDPITNPYEAFTSMANFDWTGSTLLGGKNWSSKNLDWTYTLRWMAVTVPEFMLALMAVSLVVFFLYAVRMGVVRKNYLILREPLVYFGIAVLPLVAVAILHSTLYNGWRHLYFTMAGSILCISWLLNQLRCYLQMRVGRVFVYWIAVIPFIVVQIALNVTNIVNLHPYQNVYFNSFAKEDLRKNYELDYWGLSYREGLEFILAKDPRAKIKVRLEGHAGTIGYVSGRYGNRIVDADIGAAEYLLSNHRDHPKNFREYREIYRVARKNTVIMSVFKLK